MGTPKGFVQYNVMVEMLEQNGLTSQEIRRVAKECVDGKGTFDKVEDRGHYSSPFRGLRPDLGEYCSRVYGKGWIYRMCNKVGNKYYLNDGGRKVFQKLTPKFAGRSYSDAVRISEFNKRYEKPLDAFNKRQEEKSKRIPCTNGVVMAEGKIIMTSKSLSKDEIPTKNRKEMGFKIDDEVIFYRNFNRTLGEGYIQSIKENSIRVSDKIQISIGLEGSTIPQITYISSEHRFVEMDGSEITIALKSL